MSEPEQIRDTCGCVWIIKNDIWTCTHKCSKHKNPKPQPKRPKAECVRP